MTWGDSGETLGDKIINIYFNRGRGEDISRELDQRWRGAFIYEAVAYLMSTCSLKITGKFSKLIPWKVCCLKEYNQGSLIWGTKSLRKRKTHRHGSRFHYYLLKSLSFPSSDPRIQGQSENSDVLVQGGLVIQDTKVARR